MAAADAKAIPVRNAAYRVTLPIFDADGDRVTGATGLDSEVSIDGGTFADCASEATEIATASGIYFLDLTAAEMDGDTIAIIVKTSTVGAKTTPLVLYTAARSVNDLAFPTTTGRAIDVTAAGEVGIDFDNAAGTLDAAQFGTDAFTAAKFAADVTTELQTGLATAAALTTAQSDLDDIQTRLPAALVGGRMDSSIGAVANDAITAATLAADAIAEIQAGLATGSALTTVAGFIDTEITTLMADADDLQVRAADIQARLPAALVGGRIDSSVGAMAAGVVSAAAVGTGAIDADALATDAVTEIQSGLATGAAVASMAAFVDTEVASILAAVDTEVAAIKAKTDNLPAAPAAVSDVPTAAAIADAVLDDAIAEPAGVFAWPASLRSVAAWLGVLSRNRQTQTATTTTIRDDADATTIATRTVSDNGVVFVSGEAT